MPHAPRTDDTFRELLDRTNHLDAAGSQALAMAQQIDERRGDGVPRAASATYAVAELSACLHLLALHTADLRAAVVDVRRRLDALQRGR